MDNGTAGEPPSLYAILTIVGGTQKTVNRIDDRMRHAGKRHRYPVEKQEACFRYWEIAQQKAQVKLWLNTRVTYTAAYNYFKKDLHGIGVENAVILRRILRARINRISRNQRYVKETVKSQKRNRD